MPSTKTARGAAAAAGSSATSSASKSESQKTNHMAVSLKRNRDHTFGQFFNKEAFYDFTVTCKDEKWLCHKVILAAGSPYFNKLFEGKWKEMEENRVDFKEEQPAQIEALLLYCYDSDWKDAVDIKAVSPSIPKDQTHDSTSFTTRVQACKDNIEMHRIADAYGSRTMQQRALAKYFYYLTCDTMIMKHEDSIADIFELIYSAEYVQAKDLRLLFWESSLAEKCIKLFATYSKNGGSFSAVLARHEQFRSDFMNALLDDVSKRA